MSGPESDPRPDLVPSLGILYCFASPDTLFLWSPGPCLHMAWRKPLHHITKPLRMAVLCQLRTAHYSQDCLASSHLAGNTTLNVSTWVQGPSCYLARLPLICPHHGNIPWPVMASSWSTSPENLIRPAPAEGFLPVTHILMYFSFCVSCFQATAYHIISVCSLAWSHTQNHFLTLKSLYLAIWESLTYSVPWVNEIGWLTEWHDQAPRK